jgi:hypothetical protein
LSSCKTPRVARSAPLNPAGKPMKFSMREEAPAWPPGPSWSNNNVDSPSDDPYTAAVSPAGPAPTMAKSTSCVAQCRQMPASWASCCKEGFTRIRPLPQSMTGAFCGEPRAASTCLPFSVSVSNHMNGTKFL